jgi:hypothetical protein
MRSLREASSTRTSTFSKQPRTTCAGQSIDSGVVARGEPAIADGDLRAQACARAEQETEEKKSSATRSVIKLSRESSERFALGKNRDMGCQDGVRSAGLRSVFCQAGLTSWVF